MALTLNELPRCFSGLATQLRLLIADPTELGYGIGAGYLRARSLGGDKSDAAVRRVDRQVNILDVLAGHGNGDFAELDRLCHQYPGWFLMRANNSAVAARSRPRSGKSALTTCASRAWSPFQPARAHSRITWSISSASLARSSEPSARLGGRICGRLL